MTDKESSFSEKDFLQARPRMSDLDIAPNRNNDDQSSITSSKRRSDIDSDDTLSTKSYESYSTKSSYTSTEPSLRRRRPQSSLREEKYRSAQRSSPRRCCSCSCVLKVITGVLAIASVVLLSLALIGFYLKKPEFQCKLDDLSSTLYSNLYGQEVAIKHVLTSLRDFCDGSRDNEQLVLVFWGTTGVGKTLATTIVTNHFEANGHVVPSEFFKESNYKDWVGSRYPDKPFVYAVDDVESSEELSTIKSSTVSFTFPLILIVTTSAESLLLNESYVQSKDISRYSYTGKRPEWLTAFKDLNPIIVPFVPLTRANVKLCIEKALLNLKIKHNQNDVEKIASEYEYFHNGKVLFSKIGCKRINDKILSILTP